VKQRFFQGYRSDWKYEADANTPQAYMIWPRFEDGSGAWFPDGAEVPNSGTAAMVIVDPSMKSLHEGRIAVGVRGFFVEGGKRVAEAEVIEVLGRTTPRGA
jgi:hypothetical protein